MSRLHMWNYIIKKKGAGEHKGGEFLWVLFFLFFMGFQFIVFSGII